MEKWKHERTWYKNMKNKMNCELMLTYDTPAYMFKVYKNQLSRQTESRNLTGPKTLPTIWHTYMKLVTKYQISAINSCWEKFDEKYLERTQVKQYTPSPPHRWSGGITILTVFQALTNSNTPSSSSESLKKTSSFVTVSFSLSNSPALVSKNGNSSTLYR